MCTIKRPSQADNADWKNETQIQKSSSTLVSTLKNFKVVKSALQIQISNFIFSHKILKFNGFISIFRYDSPVNASPSRIADHLRPWEDDLDGSTSRRSFFSATPFLPSTPGLVGGRLSTTSPKGRKSSTLPSRASPAHPGGALTYSTDFSTDMSDGEKESVKPDVWGRGPYPPHQNGGGGSLPNMLPPGSSLAPTDDEDDEEMEYIPQASNVYPLHLLLTTNYRLPGDVDRCNLERHLTDAEFEAVFKCLRDEFYRLPNWKRCDLKRRNFLF